MNRLTENLEKKERIIIVDDDLSICRTLVLIFNKKVSYSFFYKDLK